jgi:hypothetical protein
MAVYLKNAGNILDLARDSMALPRPLRITVLGESNGVKQGKVDLGG